MNKITKKFQWKWFLFIIPFIVIGLYLLYLNSYPIDKDFDKAGKLGDSFGVLNSLFSGLAFIALVITIYLQQQDIRDTKKETQKQNFENSFFKMIDLYNSVVKDLSLERPKDTIAILPDGTEQFEYLNYKILGQKLYIGTKDCQGREVIIELLKILDIYKNVVKKYPNRYKIVQGEYEDFYKEYENVIRHYFSTIYQILKFVDKDISIDKEEKKDYINLFLAQIPKKELKLFYFHVKSPFETDKIMPILIKYDFFQNDLKC